jgi:hypothetical protein
LSPREAPKRGSRALGRSPQNRTPVRESVDNSCRRPMNLSAQAASESVTGRAQSSACARGDQRQAGRPSTRPVEPGRAGASRPRSSSGRSSVWRDSCRARSWPGSAGAGRAGTHRPSWLTHRLPSRRSWTTTDRPAQLRPSGRRGSARSPPGQLTVLSRPTRRG